MANFGKERNQYIGGSDFGCVLDVNPYKKRIELLLEKSNVLANTFEGNEATKRGQRLEDTIIELFEKETKLKVSDKQGVYKREQTENCMTLLCHLDGFTSDNAVFEAKTTDVKSKTWDNGIPEYYVAQLEFNMFLKGVEKSYIAVGFCDNDNIVDFKYFEYYRQMTDDNIISECEKFTADVEYYKQLGVINTGIIKQEQIDHDLIDQYETLNYEIKKIKDQLNPLEKQKKIIEDKLKNQIGKDWGISDNMYKITLGNRITSPTSDYKVSRSMLKVEYI